MLSHSFSLYNYFLMNKEPITIKDIANALGVSISTVSRALKDNPDISEKRRKAIQEYAREHRYQPNTLATTLRSTRGARSKLIGVILPQFTHYYFSCILTGIEETCSKHGYHIIVAQTGDSYEREKEIIETLRQARVCGFIVSQAKDTTQYEHFHEVVKDGTPLVFFDRICTDLITSRVVVDDYAGAFTATEHLIKTGCRRICFFGATMNLEISKNRYNGYRDALLKYKLPVEKEMFHICDNREEAERLTPEIMAMENKPDGFFTINDDTALGVLYTCKTLGYRIPDDVSICGFTDGIRAKSSDPQLTTVEQRGYDVGVAAANSLIKEYEAEEEDKHKYRNCIIKTKLIVRGTTKPLLDKWNPQEQQ